VIVTFNLSDFPPNTLQSLARRGRMRFDFRV
jgi:hypothetical protein